MGEIYELEVQLWSSTALEVGTEFELKEGAQVVARGRVTVLL